MGRTLALRRRAGAVRRRWRRLRLPGQGGAPLLDDNRFLDPRPRLGRPPTTSPPLRRRAGRVILRRRSTAAPGGGQLQLQSMAGADLCVTVALNPTPLPNPANEDTVGAVGVWSLGGADNAQFLPRRRSRPDGTAAITRLVRRTAWTHDRRSLRPRRPRSRPALARSTRSRSPPRAIQVPLRQRHQDHRFPRPCAEWTADRRGSMPKAARRSPPGCSRGCRSIPIRHRGWGLSSISKIAAIALLSLCAAAAAASACQKSGNAARRIR